MRGCRSWSSWCVGEEDSKVANRFSWCVGKKIAAADIRGVGKEDRGQGFDPLPANSLDVLSSSFQEMGSGGHVPLHEQAPSAMCGVKAFDTNDFIFLFDRVKQH